MILILSSMSLLFFSSLLSLETRAWTECADSYHWVNANFSVSKFEYFLSNLQFLIEIVNTTRLRPKDLTEIREHWILWNPQCYSRWTTDKAMNIIIATPESANSKSLCKTSNKHDLTCTSLNFFYLLSFQWNVKN